MWPKATNVLEEFYYHWRRKRGVWGVCVWGGGGGGCVLGGGGKGQGRNVPPTFFIGGGGAMVCLCPPLFIFHLNYMFI